MAIELPTEHFEHAEHAAHAAHSGDPFLAQVSMTIAILAVAAATVGSLETIETANREKPTIRHCGPSRATSTRTISGANASVTFLSASSLSVLT